MNVWGMNERSWRKARKRAVSPIIATILLVAITVVLAAVLYVLISGLTHGPGSTPLAIGWGSPINATSAATSTPGCIKGTTNGQTTFVVAYCYTVTIQGPSSGLSTSNVLLSVRGAVSGATVAWPLAGSLAVTLLSPTATGVQAVYCPSTTSGVTGATCASSNTWVLPTGSSFNGIFASGQTIVIAVAAGQAAGNTGGLLGLSLEAVGQSGYSGTQGTTAFS